METRDLTYEYPDGRTALRGVNLLLSEGERVSIVGPNGAGKSTLLLLLAGLKEPSEGGIRAFGKPMSKLKGSGNGSRIGLVFQDPDDQLFMPTVFEDVAFGPTNMGLPEVEIRKRVEEALAATGLAGFDERVPHHLSVGEKRRAAIAGVLAMSPEIILLDEPTSGLDPMGSQEIMRLIERLEGTIVLVTHNMDLALRFSDRIVLLQQRILFDGHAQELFEDGLRLERVGLVQPTLFSIAKALRERGMIGEEDRPKTPEELIRILSR